MYKYRTGKIKICALADMAGLSMANFDYQLLWKKHLLEPLQEIFEPIIDSMYIVNAGIIFRTIWYIISKFVSLHMKNKVYYISDLFNISNI